METQLQPSEKSGHPETRNDRMVRLATRLLELGVSIPVTRELLAYDLDIVEQQLDWLSARRVRRKSSLIVTAIRENYEKPAALNESEFDSG